MKNLKFLSLILMIFFVASCTKDLLNEPASQTADDTALLKSSSPKVKIAVMSDVHYMHPSLFPANLEDSPTFLSGLNRDRKIPQMSDPIFRKVVSELIKEKPDIVLISGDMAREGELIDHQTVCGLLQQLENNGIKVYVAPGNNDILNPDAYSYTAEPPFRVPNISVDQYTSMYGNFGYNEALYRDENSLSYICQPCDGLWIMAIDDCKRTVLPDGSAVSKVSGAINPLTLVWIQEKMAEANANGIMVIPMMHYGILEHYKGQKNLEPLIKNAAESIPVLMNAGIRLVLTGHYHANSISSFTENGKTLTDIQTGSLVTPPYPYRMMTLDDNFINIDTRFVTSIDGEVPGGMDFLTYSETTIAVYMIGFFNYYLPKLFGLSPEDATLLAPSFAHAWLAYFAGDEKMSPAERNTINTLVQSKSPSLVTLLNNVWTDLAPKDTKTHIKLK